jgi:polyisoprenyl-teichoic acid--peptidoglycan teichoic acid transferase
MASRTEEISYGASARPLKRSRQTISPVTAGQRILFVLALLTFGLAISYTGLSLLSRVTPALFPGQTLTIPGVDVKALPGITRPGKDSVFNQRINLLIIGVDKRPWEPHAGNLTDTIMVATLDPIGKTTNLLSFPRDMLIDIHSPQGFVYQSRINESYGIGYRNGGNFEAGAAQMKRDIEKNFGIPIDNVVLLDFKGVEALVNAIDGIDVDIPYELSVGNWFYSDDDINGIWLSFPPGPRHLDGYHAVAFGRHRAYDDDFVRVKRQQLVVEAAVQKVFARGIFQNPLPLWNAYAQTITTDMSRTKMLQLAPLLNQTQGRMKTYSLADPVDGKQTLTPYTTYEGAAVQLWDAENVQYWLSQVFTKAVYADSFVEIHNGMGSDGDKYAAALGRFLAYSKGLPTVGVGFDVDRQPKTTITLYGEDRRPMAEDIAKWMDLPVSVIEVQPRTDDALPHIVITLGSDFKLPGG